jgi:hypothetical protein
VKTCPTCHQRIRMTPHEAAKVANLARQQKMTPEERSAAGKKAVNARWAKKNASPENNTCVDKPRVLQEGHDDTI